MQYEVDIASDYKELFLKARTFLIEKYGFTETRKPRITTYSDENGGICHVRTMPHGIDFGFLKGVRMEDNLGLLTGTGKVMRVLSMATFDPACIGYYLQQAVDINSQAKQ